MRLTALAGFILVLGASSLGRSATCPLGVGQTLTLTQVMHDFRDTLYTPDQVALSGSSDASSVTTQQLQDSADAVGVAVACTDAVLAKNNPALIPDGASGLSGQALDTYLQKFYIYIGELRDAFVSYQNMFTLLIATNGPRDFQSVYGQSMTVRNIEVEAHSHF